MTFEEKVGQMMQIAPFFFIRHLDVEVFGEVKDLGLTQNEIFHTGSVLGIGGAKEMIAVQERYLKTSRLGIPLLFMADIIHGYETIFPVPIALASSFNEELVKKASRIAAIEASTAGIHVTFAPMADLVRDPRWGRVVESFGEDPYLNEVMTKASVLGFQTDDIRNEGALASCVKHFAGYGASEAGRDYNTVDLSRIQLHNYYFSGYRGAVEAHAKLLMTSFNVIEGVPATVSSYLLRDVLRDLWQFKGVTISDYDSLHQILAHGCAEDDKDAAKRGIVAGLDIEMASSCYIRNLKELMNEGIIDMNLIDEAVLRILDLKNEIGLFDNPYKGASIEREQKLVRSKEHLDESLKIAKESVVLLENNGILPLKNTLKVALVGPYATSRETNGPWSWHGNNALNQSLYEALISKNIDVIYSNEHTDLKTYSKIDFKKIKEADVVICAVGEHFRESGEAHSKAYLKLPRMQEAFVMEMRKIAKNLVTIVTSGRPLLLNELKASDALIYTWFLGSRHAEAVVDILYGITNPSGKLPMSFPRAEGQIPVYYNHLNTGRPYHAEGHNEYTSYYLDLPNDPMYTFGEGKSYTTFEYKQPRMNQNVMSMGDITEVSIDIKNTGNMKGMETAMLFIRDMVAGISRPVKELKKFKKIELNPGETKTVIFNISQDDLGYFDGSGKKIIEPGMFDIMVGPNAKTFETLKLELKKG